MESNSDKKELESPFQIFASDEGNLVIYDKEREKEFEFDFDVSKLNEKNLPKIEKLVEDIQCPQILSKIKKKIEDKLKLGKDKKEQKEDLTEDRTEVIDGQKVKVEAEGDDDDAEGKIRGDPYNEEEKFKKGSEEDPSKEAKKEKKKKMDMEEMTAFFKEQFAILKSDMNKELQPIKNAVEDLQKSKKIEEDMKANDIREVLSNPPYRLSLDYLNSLSLEKLEEQKRAFDQLPMIKDFREQEEDAFEKFDNTVIRHEDVKKVDFSNNDRPVDARYMVLQEAQNKRKTNEDFMKNKKEGP